MLGMKVDRCVTDDSPYTYILMHMLVSFRLMLLIGAGEADECIL
jgi:hypothetical protein